MNTRKLEWYHDNLTRQAVVTVTDWDTVLATSAMFRLSASLHACAGSAGSTTSFRHWMRDGTRVVVILDTRALIFDALAPERLSRKARQAIERAHTDAALACADISLWEIAMLIAKQRLHPGTDTLSFLRLLLAARNLQVLPVVPEIAVLSVSPEDDVNADPADRIIVATAVYHQAALVTRDKDLRNARLPISVVW